MLVSGTDAKDIALHFIGAKELQLTKQNIMKNTVIAKQILELGFPKESIIIAIDLNVDKMYSLGFIKFVIEEVHNAIVAKEKDDAVKGALKILNATSRQYSEVGDNGENRNKDKLARRTSVSRLGKSTPNDLFKQ